MASLSDDVDNPSEGGAAPLEVFEVLVVVVVAINDYKAETKVVQRAD